MQQRWDFSLFLFPDSTTDWPYPQKQGEEHITEKQNKMKAKYDRYERKVSLMSQLPRAPVSETHPVLWHSMKVLAIKSTSLCNVPRLENCTLVSKLLANCGSSTESWCCEKTELYSCSIFFCLIQRKAKFYQAGSRSCKEWTGSL